jgi:hypothetical protein
MREHRPHDLLQIAANAARRHSFIERPQREFAFLGDTLDTLESTFDAVEVSAVLGRQELQDFAILRTYQSTHVLRPKTDLLTNSVFVAHHPNLLNTDKSALFESALAGDFHAPGGFDFLDLCSLLAAPAPAILKDDADLVAVVARPEFPAASSAVAWPNTSLLPSSNRTKPKPLVALKNLM